MPHAQAFALDDVLARGGHVDQQIDQVVLEQVDLVEVQEAAVGAGQQPGLEGLDALGQCALEVERADHAVLGRSERQVDDRHRHQPRPGPARGAQRVALLAGTGRRSGVAAVAAVGDGAHLGQQPGQRPDRGGLAGATVAQHQHAADGGVDRRDQDRPLHLVLADDRGKRKGDCHVGRSGRS